jgi:hypothetical protein
VDWVTIYSPDLGDHLRITVYNNGSNPNGVGGPDWEVGYIRVMSARYLGSGLYANDDNTTFTAGATITKTLTPVGVSFLDNWISLTGPTAVTVPTSTLTKLFPADITISVLVVLSIWEPAPTT